MTEIRAAGYTRLAENLGRKPEDESDDLECKLESSAYKRERCSMDDTPAPNQDSTKAYPLPDVVQPTPPLTTEPPPDILMQPRSQPPPPPPQSGEVLLPGAANESQAGGAQPLETKTPPTKSKIFLGVFLVLLVAGLIVGGLFFFQQRSAKPETKPQPPEPLPLSLTLESPAEGEITTIGEVTVRGKTLSHSVVVFFTETDEDSIESQTTGDFEGNLTLTAGSNTLLVLAIGVDGKEKREMRSITYEATESGKAASPSAQRETGSKQKAIHGIITGINESVLTVLEQAEKEKFYNIVATGSAVVRIKGNQTESVSNLELGSRIVVVGTLDQEYTLIAKLIHVITGKP